MPILCARVPAKTQAFAVAKSAKRHRVFLEAERAIPHINVWKDAVFAFPYFGEFQRKMPQNAHTQKSIRPLIFSIFIAWTTVVGGSLAWNVYQNYHQSEKLALQEALTIFNKDQGFRLWGTRHGGVYVPITEETPPSPYMAHIEDRDITTPSGKELTLLNPAYMLRQMMEDFATLYGVRGHITGLTLLRPANAPDDWETVALTALKNNPKLQEFSEITAIGDLPYIRMMRPMYMKPGCDKCHGHLGFKEGDFRGGVSVSVPLDPYIERRDKQTFVLSATHGAIWAIGLFGLFTGGRRIERSLTDTLHAEAEVRQLNRQLESRVEQRTRELTEQSRRLDITIDSAADGIIVIDENGTIDTFNKAAEAMFGYSAPECIGQPITMLMPEPYATEHSSYLETYKRTGERHIIGRGREVEAKRKDGSLFPMYLAVSQLDLENRVLFSGICRDLTEHKKVEHDLVAAKAQAERANRAKSEFLASMSHELRTPLNGIIGFSQLMQYDPKEKLTEQQADYTQMIMDAGEHLLSLINDILDLSRIESEGFSLSLEPVNPHDALGNCLTLIAPLSEKHNITVEAHLPPESSKCVVADEVRFKQIVMNLLSNGAKYNVPGGTVTLHTEIIENRMRISVTDTGIGIPPDRLESLFEPFNRLGQEGGQIEGTGIGLTITRKLIQRMNGDMGVDSQEGQGTTFWFELPTCEQDTQTQPDLAEQDLHDDVPPEGDFRILYIEDNPHNRTLMKQLLKPYPNLRYETATTGEEGVATAVNAPPDLVLMDIDLPGISGHEALRRLKHNERTEHIPVIAISANALPRDIRKGKKSGFLNYLTKPINVKRTKQVIFNALDDLNST